MLNTLLGIVIEVREEHSQKASYPIFITPSGIETDMRERQPRKAELPIKRVPSLIV